MTEAWVDTDFGFDDLWALQVLRARGVKVPGVSLVAGNAPLDQVVANALGAAEAYGFRFPLWRGADRPLKRLPETAQRILGPLGMRSRGAHLPLTGGSVPQGAVEALGNWIMSAPSAQRVVLALGPLTNIAQLVLQAPDVAHRISRLVWMGGSSGPGNHSEAAEFNALADPEAVEMVARAGVRLDIVDLMFCRQVLFGSRDMPKSDPLTQDLLGGYLDIALERGRDAMAIYDPVAALVVAEPDRILFEPREMHVVTEPGPQYGATLFSTARDSPVRVAVSPDVRIAGDCLAVLSEKALAHG